MRLSLLVAMDENRGIGIDNRLPWHLSSDLKRFKSLTMGHYLIMGRKTYESIGKPLPGRTTIVITRNRQYQAEGCLVAYSVEEALNLAKAAGELEVFIIGGGEIFSQVIDRADRLYLTQVRASVEADVYFPEIFETQWCESESITHGADEKDQYPSTYRLLERRNQA